MYDFSILRPSSGYFPCDHLWLGLWFQAVVVPTLHDANAATWDELIGSR